VLRGKALFLRRLFCLGFLALGGIMNDNKEGEMFGKMNQRVKNLTVVDIGLVKWSVLFATIIIVKIFPQLLKIDYVVLVALMLICGAKPLYKFWFKK